MEKEIVKRKNIDLVSNINYKASGYTKDTCFKLHGYPNQYKQLKKEKASVVGKDQVNMVNSPLEEDFIDEKKENLAKWVLAISNLVQQEHIKVLKEKQSVAKKVSFAQVTEFAGNSASNLLECFRYGA